MRVTVVAPQYPPDLLSAHQDGVVTYFTQMVMGYRMSGAEVTVLTTGKSGGYVEIGEFGERIRRVKWPNSFGGSSSRRMVGALQIEAQLLTSYLQSSLLNRPPDLLEVPDWLTPLSIPSLAPRVFMKLHGPSDFIRQLNGESASIAQRVFDRRARLWARRASVLHAGAAVLVDFAREKWGLTREIPITPDPWAADARPAGRSSVPFSQRTLELVAIGRLEWRKGQHVLLEALRRLAPDMQQSPWRLTLIGRDTRSGPDGQSYRRYCESVTTPEVLNHVRWIDGVAMTELAAIHRAADVVAVCSLDGNYGYTTIQALCDGACVVTTREPGVEVSPYVRSGQNGMLVPPGDVEALAGALRLLVKAPSIRAEMGENACRVREVVNPAAVARRVLTDAGLLTSARVDQSHEKRG